MLDVHDLIVKELFENKSLASLIYLINNGRELEFRVLNKKCFITCDSSKKYVSMWVENEEQSFESVEDLISNSIIENEQFIHLWKTAELETLF